MQSERITENQTSFPNKLNHSSKYCHVVLSLSNHSFFFWSHIHKLYLYFDSFSFILVISVCSNFDSYVTIYSMLCFIKLSCWGKCSNNLFTHLKREHIHWFSKIPNSSKMLTSPHLDINLKTTSWKLSHKTS